MMSQSNNNDTHTHTQRYDNVYDSLKEYMFFNQVINKNTMKCHHVKSPANANAGASANANAGASANANAGASANTNTSKQRNHVKDINEKYFIPSEQDKLFWCFYIFLHNEYEYTIAKNKSFIIEKSFKMESLKQLNTKETLDFLKPLKIKPFDLEDELMNKQKISLKGLQYLCKIHNLSVIYVSGRTFYEFLYNNDDTDENTFIIVQSSNKEDCILRKSETDISFIKNIRDTYWRIDNLLKPLKGMTSYTLSELKQICLKMDISTEDKETKKKKTMKTLYQELLSKM